jgi:hypothetical protein
VADLTITAASVVQASGNASDGTAGATITAGQLVYLDSTTSTYLVGDANVTGKDAIAGVALNGASSGQPLKVATSGVVTIGATVAVGTTYILSAAATGAICPDADAVTGWKKTILGVATSATQITLKVFASGAAIP